MKIKKIQKINKYKSFHDFSWHSFFNTECFHDSTNILYGENGSGKTSVCNILKSVSKNKDFEKNIPNYAELMFDDGLYKFITGSWDKNIDKSAILFFDKEFVERHVHLGHDRGSQQGEQEQESGKLIIEFDGDAIKLRSVRNQLREERDKKNMEFDVFCKSNESALKFNLSKAEEELYSKYKDKNAADMKKTRGIFEGKKIALEGETRKEQKLLTNVKEIESIKELNDVNIDLHLSDENEYQKLFDFDLKEKTILEAKQELVDKLKRHKEFFDLGIEIRGKCPGQCPFCQTRNEEKAIKDMLDMYNQIYDDTYKNQKELFLNKKSALIKELDQIMESMRDFDVRDIFIKLKKLDSKYAIKGIYSVEEEEKTLKPKHFEKISYLREKVVFLKKPNKEDVKSLYNKASSEVESAILLLREIKILIKAKNQIIGAFKESHTDKKLNDRLDRDQGLLKGVKDELEFIQSKKVDNQKLMLEKRKQQDEFWGVLDKLKRDYKSVKDTYESYCSSGAFPKVLGKIEAYFNHFNFQFKLRLDDTRNTGLTKELPFAFKVIDLDGKKRDLKEGLSEGEIQVLSLCFFFAFLDIQKDKDKKIIVFDDPITSLDDSNLSSLVDLISDEKGEFSQTFVFTHHRTFFKFLRKKFREEKDKSKEFNILRNKIAFGGSFICKSKEEKFIDKLNNFENHLVQISKSANGFDIELKIVEYGQYLRYEIESFIKYKLLHLNQMHEFTNVINGIKNNKNIEDDDLDKIKQIYSFCNWTTSHVDVGDDHGMAQLKEKISEFASIYNKVVQI